MLLPLSLLFAYALCALPDPEKGLWKLDRGNYINCTRLPFIGYVSVASIKVAETAAWLGLAWLVVCYCVLFKTTLFMTNGKNSKQSKCTRAMMQMQVKFSSCSCCWLAKSRRWTAPQRVCGFVGKQNVIMESNVRMNPRTIPAPRSN